MNQILLKQSDPVEIHDPVAILDERDIRRLLRRPHALGQSFHPHVRFQEKDETILDFCAGGQHGILIGRHQRLKLSILRTDIVQDSPVVQDLPTERWAEGAIEGSRREQLVQVFGGVAERSIDGNMGIEIGFSDADERGLSGGRALGAATSGRRRNKSAGMPTATSGRRRRNAAGSKALFQVFRRDPKQDAQSIAGHPQLNF